MLDGIGKFFRGLGSLLGAGLAVSAVIGLGFMVAAIGAFLGWFIIIVIVAVLIYAEWQSHKEAPKKNAP